MLSECWWCLLLWSANQFILNFKNDQTWNVKVSKRKGEPPRTPLPSSKMVSWSQFWGEKEHPTWNGHPTFFNEAVKCKPTISQTTLWASRWNGVVITINYQKLLADWKCGKRIATKKTLRHSPYLSNYQTIWLVLLLKDNCWQGRLKIETKNSQAQSRSRCESQLLAPDATGNLGIWLFTSCQNVVMNLRRWRVPIGSNTILRFDSSVVETLKKIFLQFSPRARSVSPISPVNRCICMLCTNRWICVPLNQLQPQPHKQWRFKISETASSGSKIFIKNKSQAEADVNRSAPRSPVPGSYFGHYEQYFRSRYLPTIKASRYQGIACDQ